MAAAERSKTEYRERLDRTVQLMNRLNLPPRIQDRIRMWFTYSWSTQKTLGKIEPSFFKQILVTDVTCALTDEITSLVALPHNMQMDIAMNVHVQTLSKVQLFQDCDPALIRDLVNFKLKLTI
jgi:cyclic nucleotide gated channel beta 1